MPGTTSKGLLKPLDGEAADIAVINANMDTIDDFGMGFKICTSGTRPGVPWTGLVIYETDTECRLVWDSAAWKPITTVICTSLTRPAPVVTGQQIYETDTKIRRLWDGTAWVYSAKAVTSTYVSIIANAGPLSAETTIATLPSITANGVTPVKLSFCYGYMVLSVATDGFSMRFKDNGVQVAQFEIVSHQIVVPTATFMLVYVPTAGAHVYTATLFRAAGTGTISLSAAAALPTIFAAEEF